MIKTFEKAKSAVISKNFKSTEFDCKGKGCCSVTKIDTKLVEYLQKIRDHFEKPVTITSAYRCLIHNKNVGGASASKHRYGMAADIKVKGIAPAEVAKYAESIGILGIGLYETDKDGYFVHIDTRNKKAFWYGQAQAHRDTFGGIFRNADITYWQIAAIQDGFNLPSGTDGIWGPECIAVAKKAICKKRLTYKYKNLSKIVQKAVGVTADGKFGNSTRNAVITYQKNNGLVADGVVGLNTWKKILGI